MELTLKNYTTTLPKDIILMAKKNKVRECDETEKGHFIAYVDEGSESFDVSLTVKAVGKIAAHTCDCDSAHSFCRHKTALLLYIATGENPKNSVKIKKKESKAGALLDMAGHIELKEWIKGVIAKNKDIELSFIHHFSVKEKLTPLEVIKITSDAIKAVIANKKTIDPTQLKKLVELWAEMLAPVIDDYYGNVIDEKSFLNFHTMLESWLTFQAKVETNSNKVAKYIDTVLQGSQGPIADLINEEAWDKAVSYFISKVPEEVNRIRFHYLSHLKNITSISSPYRKEKIISLLAKQFGKSSPDSLINGASYCKFIFDIVDENGLFSKYYQLFKPIRFDNIYNQKLIGLLIQNDNLDIAKKYCEEQISYNFREEYSIPYLQNLKEIFTIQNDEDNLAKVMSVLFPYTFDFDEYLVIIKTLAEEEKKSCRTKILSKARNASRNRNSPAIAFCFRLMDYEKGYKKMIDYIGTYTPYSLILSYFEPMFAADKAKLLEAIVRKGDDYYRPFDSSENIKTCFPGLFELSVKLYSASYLKAVISNAEKNSWGYSGLNQFLRYAKERLASV